MKFKVIAIFICCVAFMISASQLTYALSAVPTISYNGNNKTLTTINTEQTDLFSSFKNVLPGDTKTQTVVLQGVNIEQPASLYLRSETNDDKDLPEEIVLSIYKEDEFVLSKSVNCSGSLVDGVLLHTFEKNETLTLKIILEVPLSVGNEIQNIQKHINWAFTIQEDGHDFSPQTSDNSNFVFHMILFIISGSLLVFLYFYNPKDEAANLRPPK